MSLYGEGERGAYLEMGVVCSAVFWHFIDLKSTRHQISSIAANDDIYYPKTLHTSREEPDSFHKEQTLSEREGDFGMFA